MNVMKRPGPPDAALPLPKLTVSGLRFLDLANVADAAGDAIAAGHLINLAYGAFDGRESNVVPLPLSPVSAATRLAVCDPCHPSVA